MIAIVSESPADLPPRLAEQYGISIVPYPYSMSWDGGPPRDGATIDLPDLYRAMRDAPASVSVSTSAPSIGAFIEQYRAAAETAEGIVSVHLSSHLSGGFARAVLAASEAGLSCPIRHVDSGTVSMAEGYVALAAARTARQGGTLEEAERAALKDRDEVFFVVALETLEYVFRSGRVKRSAYLLGSTLSIKPIIGVVDGVAKPLSRTRSMGQATDKIASMVVERSVGKRLHLTAVHVDCPERAQELREKIEAQVQPVETYVLEVTPVIGGHTGPGLVGAAIWAESP